ncbi:hypothetical protein D7X33_16840, partial [Butyricicoccus sp. 1XD8-22]
GAEPRRPPRRRGVQGQSPAARRAGAGVQRAEPSGVWAVFSGGWGGWQVQKRASSSSERQGSVHSRFFQFFFTKYVFLYCKTRKKALKL